MLQMKDTELEYQIEKKKYFDVINNNVTKVNNLFLAVKCFQQSAGQTK